MVGTGEQFHPFLLGTGVRLGVDRHHSVPEPAEGAEGVGSKSVGFVVGLGKSKANQRWFRDLVPHATKKDGSEATPPTEVVLTGDQVMFGPSHR